MNKEEFETQDLQFNKLYDKTKFFGRTQFVREIQMQINDNKKLQQENKQLKNNWNKLKNIAKSQSDFKLKYNDKSLWFEADELLNKMQELEKVIVMNEEEFKYGFITSEDYYQMFPNMKTGKGFVSELIQENKQLKEENKQLKEELQATLECSEYYCNKYNKLKCNKK